MNKKFKYLILIFLFTFSNIYADSESYVLMHDANHYSKDFKLKLMVRVFEKRAHVYTVFGKYDLAISYLERAEKLMPNKHEFYAYLKKEIIIKKSQDEKLKENNIVAINNFKIIKVKTPIIHIRVKRENG